MWQALTKPKIKAVEAILWAHLRELEAVMPYKPEDVAVRDYWHLVNEITDDFRRESERSHVARKATAINNTS